MRRKELSKKILTAIAIALVTGLIFIDSAEAVTNTFEWTGASGYSMKGSFTYDETIAPETITEHGSGKTQALQSLTVTFYAPSGETIHTYENAIDGIATGNYFEFNFDPVRQQPYGNIDLGGEFSGEMYLKGIVNEELSLIEVKQSGEERVIDLAPFILEIDSY